MVPLFIKHNEHDKLTMPLYEIDNEMVANWVEERLIEFIDVYLQIDHGSGDFADDLYGGAGDDVLRGGRGRDYLQADPSDLSTPDETPYDDSLTSEQALRLSLTHA